MKHPKKPNVAYILSRFPKISETFVLYEIVYLEKKGVPVEIFSLVREKPDVMHCEAAQRAGSTHYASLVSFRVCFALVYWLIIKPVTMVSLLLEIVYKNRESKKFLLRALVALPKSACFAYTMKHLNISHIHAHFATHAALAAYCIHRLTKIPYSFTTHAHDIYVERAMLDIKLRHAKLVITISQFNRNFLINLYGDTAASKIKVIYCGVDISRFSPVSAVETKIPTIVCIASLHEYKGHKYLVEACSLLKKELVIFRCLCVGGGWMRDIIQKQIQEKNLENDVQLPGPQNHDQVLALLSTASMVVLPSIITDAGKMEGIPVSLMEAMAMKIPVIASDISGVSELVEHGVTGLLVPQKDPRQLAESIKQYIHNPDLAKSLAKAAREKVCSQFNQEINYYEFYKTIQSLTKT